MKKNNLLQPVKLTKYMQDFEFEVDGENIFNSFKYIEHNREYNREYKHEDKYDDKQEQGILSPNFTKQKLYKEQFEPLNEKKEQKEQTNDFLFDIIMNDVVQTNTIISKFPKIDTFLKQNKEELKKKKKQVIPKNIKKIVWNTYIGSEIIRHKCLCCKKVTIENTFFECGHVISEKDGGTLEISNLRPICGECNRSMGCKNMVEYVKMYGLFIG